MPSTTSGSRSPAARRRAWVCATERRVSTIRTSWRCWWTVSSVKQFMLERRPAGTLNADGWHVRMAVKAGPRDVIATFVKPPSTKETEWLRQRFQRPIFLSNNINLVASTPYQPAVASVTISGPFNATGPGDTPSRRRVFVCRPATSSEEVACARKILSSLVRRGVPAAGDRRRCPELVDLLRAGQVGRRVRGRNRGCAAGAFGEPRVHLPDRTRSRRHRAREQLPCHRPGAGVAAVVLSVEQHSRRAAPGSRGARAAEGSRGPRASRFGGCSPIRSRTPLVENFVGQWLQLRNLDAKRPSEPLFPDFDESCAQAFRRETELFFASIIRDDRSILDLLTADYTFVNERLAKHYGIPNVKGSHFRRVTLDATTGVAACSARAACSSSRRTPSEPHRCSAASGFSQYSRNAAT